MTQMATTLCFSKPNKVSKDKILKYAKIIFLKRSANFKVGAGFVRAG